MEGKEECPALQVDERVPIKKSYSVRVEWFKKRANVESGESTCYLYNNEKSVAKFSVLKYIAFLTKILLIKIRFID